MLSKHIIFLKYSDEHACTSAASLLIMNQDEIMLDDNEEIFDVEIVSYGGAIGGLKPIGRKYDTI